MTIQLFDNIVATISIAVLVFMLAALLNAWRLNVKASTEQIKQREIREKLKLDHDIEKDINEFNARKKGAVDMSALVGTIMEVISSINKGDRDDD